MNEYSSHARALEQAMRSLGRECPAFQFQGATVSIIPGTVETNAPLREGGFTQIFDLKLHCLVSAFISPAIGDAGAVRRALLNKSMTYLGESYRIYSAAILPGALIMALGANSLNEEA